ncbi:SWIM zinc finger family protein, partial [Oceanospirillum sp. HFRX-1_2]
MPPLSLEQAESLAPDSGTLNRARKIAKSSKYQNVGQSERAIWGTALGSKAYESYVDLNGPAYKCSCPVKKLPCKHLMGLMLLVAAEPSAATSATPPEALTAWLEKRDGAAQAKATKAAAKASGEGVKDSAAQARRAENREANVQQGISELKQFLDDIVSNGLLEAKKHKYDAWQQVRRRLIDAQAKGLASQLEQIRLMMGGSGDWTRNVLQEISALHSLLCAWENRGNLPPELADEVRMRIGWNKTRDEVLSQDGPEGDWLIINQQTLYQSDLYSQQIWLLH